VWELQEHRYVERVHATGEDEVRVAQPFALSVRPVDLVDAAADPAQA
jgi:hypothetical protein